MSCGNSGESSHTNENDGETSERPLKKARYVWEVKGKYHLKESCSKTETKKPEENHLIEARNAENQNNIDDCENNNIIINNNEEDCCRKSIVERSERILDEADSDFDDFLDSSDEDRTDCSDVSKVPVTLVSSKPKDFDYYLERWQSRHIARGFVDNTINLIVESYEIDSPERNFAQLLSVCQSFENCTAGNRGHTLEDEGITMAIQSHGLQAQDTSAQNVVKISQSKQHSSEANIQEPVDHMEHSPCIDNTINELTDSGNADSVDSMSCDSLNHQEQDDFMNAAVSVAIQNKGLSSSTY